VHAALLDWETTTRRVDIGGVRIGENEKVLLFLSGANRDPRRWAEPDQFDIRRKAAGHVGFGAGIHLCVGAAFARMEGEAMLGALARQVGSLEPNGAPVPRLNNTLSGFTELPLVLRA
jgi:cytochrome P450